MNIILTGPDHLPGFFRIELPFLYKDFRVFNNKNKHIIY